MHLNQSSNNPKQNEEKACKMSKQRKQTKWNAQEVFKEYETLPNKDATNIQRNKIPIRSPNQIQ